MNRSQMLKSIEAITRISRDAREKGAIEVADMADKVISCLTSDLASLPSKWSAIKMIPRAMWDYWEVLVKARRNWMLAPDLSIKNKSERHVAFMRSLESTPLSLEAQRIEKVWESIIRSLC